MADIHTRSGTFFRHRGLLLTPPLVLALAWPISEAPYDYLVWPVGLVMFLTGVIGRIWAQQHLHFRLKISVTFTDSGPYSLVRNPIYIFNTWICVGLTVLSHAVWLAPFTLIWCCILYHFVVRDEEKSLTQYGTLYKAYCNEVRRWVPRFPQKPLLFVNEYFARSAFAERFNIAYLVPFALKEIVYRIWN